MSVLPTHPTTAIRAYGYSGESAPAPIRVQAASKTNSSDEDHTSSFQGQPDSGHGRDDSRAHGVLRLIQEGHFRGVADARLRLNFQQELAGADEGETRSVFQQQLAQVSDQFVSLADALVPAELQTDTVAGAFADALAVFQENAAKALEKNDSANASSYAAILSGVQAAFDTFSGSVRGTFSAAIEDFDSRNAEAESTSESSFEIFDFMARLASTFSSTLNGLADRTTAAQHSPSPTTTSGDETSYDRFVAEYSRLKNPGGAETAEHVNIQA